MSEASALARRAAAHVFVDDLDSLELSADDQHHLARVLRLRPGEQVTAADGTGAVRSCIWAGGHLEAVDDPVVDPPSDPPLCVGFALTKADKPEWAVQRLTELGVDRIVPFVAERSVVRWDPDKAARNVERLRKVAREAAVQSRRSRVPEVADIAAFAQVVAVVDPHSLALAEPGGGPIGARHTCVLVGPEGGWSPAEMEAVRSHVSLGDTVLRAETAAVVAGALLTAVRAEIVFLNAKSGLSADTL